MNRAAELLLGVSAEQAIGHSLALIIPEALRARHAACFRAAMSSGRLTHGGQPARVEATTPGDDVLPLAITLGLLAGPDGAAAGGGRRAAPRRCQSRPVRTASAEARQRADDLIWEGNVELLEHEQRAVVQPNYDRLSRASAWLVSTGSATSFEVRGVRQEIAYSTSFYLYSFTRGIPHALRARTWPRITRFDDRWRWLVTSVVPRFRRFDADTHLVDASLRHTFDEARDFASIPCVLPRSPADGPRRAAQPRLWHRPRPKG